MKLSLIVAISDNNAIGKKNEMPWYLPADLKFFKRITMGKPIVMGRKTFESIGKQLPGRLNIVLSGSPELKLPEGVHLINNVNLLLEKLELTGADEAFVIGGGKIFEILLPSIERLYVTRVRTVIPDADVFFPPIDHTQWMLMKEEHHLADVANAFDYTFQLFDRVEL